MVVNYTSLPVDRVRKLLAAARKARVLVVGDVMLDQFIWGGVSRISPEAPVPVVEFARESFMPGGAANVARNLAAFNVLTELFGMIGRDENGRRLKDLLCGQNIHCGGLLANAARLPASKPASSRTSNRSSALTAKPATAWTRA